MILGPALSDDGLVSLSEQIVGKEFADDEVCCEENKITAEMAMKWSLEQSIENVIPLGSKLFDPG
jgi:hypothetical protein